MTLRSRLAGAAIVLGLALAATGAALWQVQSHSQPQAVPVVNRGTVPASQPAGPATAASSAAARARTGSVPAGSRLRIPALHVDAPVGRVSAVDGVMQIPRDPHRLAWWRDGAAPGDTQGSAVIVGHVNFHGVSGALASLPSLRQENTVSLTEPDRRTLRFRVVAVRTYPKSHGIPAAVFSRDGNAQLALITCGGPFDASTGNYEDNIVAYAVPA